MSVNLHDAQGYNYMTTISKGHIIFKLGTETSVHNLLIINVHGFEQLHSKKNWTALAM